MTDNTENDDFILSVVGIEKGRLKSVVVAF